jgi:predicted DCC family thiol-disulfide oxidoreductase YuxK
LDHTLKGKQVIFYDGVCGLCEKFIDFVIRYDSKRKFMYAPLQGKTAQKLSIGLETSNSVLLWQDGQIKDQSNAAIHIICQLKWWFKPTKVFLLVPVCIRNWVYTFIAKNRYKWFGKHEQCRIPTQEERSYFLD